MIQRQGIKILSQRTGTESDSDIEFCEKLSKKVLRRDDEESMSPKYGYECPLCLVSLNCNREAFSTHIKLHKSDSKFSCKYCLDDFKNDDELQEHINDLHNDKLYHCPHKDFSSESHSAILLHFECANHQSMNVSNLENISPLQRENKSYGQDKLYHKPRPGDVETKQLSDRTSFSKSFKSSDVQKCSVCSMQLEGERSLRSHQKLHLTGFPLECCWCLMGFVDQEKLDKHRRLHDSYVKII